MKYIRKAPLLAFEILAAALAVRILYDIAVAQLFTK
jgi:hypothetical protein